MADPYLWRHRQEDEYDDLDILLLPIPGNRLPDQQAGETTIVTWSADGPTDEDKIRNSPTNDH